MQIKEVEELLQMTSYSLRYYERMGLIHPKRDENEYRNYSNEDIQSLKKIRFLRELEIPIENIESILNDSISFQEVLEKHIKTLSTQIKSLEYVQTVCEDLKDKQIPLLDAMTDEIIINKENIDKKQMIFGLNKVVEYLKPAKTIVIGTRESTREFIKGLMIFAFISVGCGLGFTYGIPNMINSMNIMNRINTLPTFEPSLGIFLIFTSIAFIVSFIVIYRLCIAQNYIELTDQKISICSKQFQSHNSIFLGMMLRQTQQRNKFFDYDELENVEINLLFNTMSGGRSGLWHIYIPEFTFHFVDGSVYKIESGISFGESTKEAYSILKEKRISIDAEELVIDYFEQNEKNGFDYFEQIYHHNGKRVR